MDPTLHTYCEACDCTPAMLPLMVLRRVQGQWLCTDCIAELGDVLAGGGVPRIRLGFTGTREGMTDAQMQQLSDLLCTYGPVPYGDRAIAWIFRHGDCQGSDAQAHQIAWRLGWVIHVHPPTQGAFRAYCAGPSRVIRHPPQPYLVRNRAIVEGCDALIAAPHGLKEVQRSGTWATIRHARKLGTPVHMLAPA